MISISFLLTLVLTVAFMTLVKLLDAYTRTVESGFAMEKV